MRTENLRQVKNNLSRVIEELPKTGPVLITKNGQTRALLVPVDDSTDLESLVLSQSRRFWELIDRSASSRRGRTRLGKLPC